MHLIQTFDFNQKLNKIKCALRSSTHYSFQVLGLDFKVWNIIYNFCLVFLEIFDLHLQFAVRIRIWDTLVCFSFKLLKVNVYSKKFTK